MVLRRKDNTVELSNEDIAKNIKEHEEKLNKLIAHLELR